MRPLAWHFRNGLAAVPIAVGAGCGSGASTEPSVSGPPLTGVPSDVAGERDVPVFSFAEDDLCDWIDAGTVSVIVANAYTEYGAAPIVTGFKESWDSDSYRGCSWAVEAPDTNDLRLSEVGLIRTESLDRALSNGSIFGAHPALSNGVQVNQAGDHPVGRYGDFVCGMEVRLSVDDHAHTLEFWHCVPPDFEADSSAVLAIADGLLQEMGWVPVEFSFATDDVCGGVTEDEIAEFVAMEFDWDGSAFEVRPERPGCQWELTGDGFGFVEVSDVRQWRDFDGSLLDPSAAFGEITDFDPEGPESVWDGVLGHPSLTDGVVVFNAGFGQFVFSVPPIDEYMGFSLHVPGEDEWDEDAFFAVADHVVGELGWLKPR